MQAMSMKKGWLASAALGALLALGACSGSSGSGPDGGDTDSDTNVECGWEVMVPPGEDNQFGGQGIEFLKGCSKDQVYLKLADQGPVYELDGDAWVETPTQPPQGILWQDMSCLSGGRSVWFGIVPYENSVLYVYENGEWNLWEDMGDIGADKIWVVADDDIYITSGGKLTEAPPLHFDGASWSPVELPEVSFEVELVDIWAGGPDSVFLVGKNTAWNQTDAVVFRFDGNSWEVDEFPEEGWADPSSIWGSGPDDVYMAVYPTSPELPRDSIVRWDGTSWNTFQEWGPVEGEEKEFEYIDWIWGTSGDNIYAGAFGSVGVWHYANGAWTLELNTDVEIAPGVLPSARRLWGSGPDDIYGGCKGAGVIHYICH
jgi:hypothetical protein